MIMVNINLKLLNSSICAPLLGLELLTAMNLFELVGKQLGVRQNSLESMVTDAQTLEISIMYHKIQFSCCCYLKAVSKITDCLTVQKMNTGTS